MLFIQFLINLYLVKQTADWIDSEFEQYRTNFHKPYNRIDHPHLFHKRISNFEDSLKRIHHLNTARPKDNHRTAFYGLTKYSDLSADEFRQNVLKNIIQTKKSAQSFKPAGRNRKSKRQFNQDLPIRFDWRDHQVIGPVLNQGLCGACWAFSITATIESMLAIHNARPWSQHLSIQQLVDCSDEWNHGCDGGDTCSTLRWLVANNISVKTEHDYPSQQWSDGLCKTADNGPGIHIQAEHICDNFQNDEYQMLELLVKHGPLIATVDASSWQHYLGGIIQYHCSNERNHAVQIVGYDLSGSIPYYIVRNSWDVDFGIQGYVHIAFGDDVCGIAEQISTVRIV